MGNLNSDTVHTVLYPLSSCYSWNLCCFKFRGQDQGSGSGCTKLWQTTSAECHMNMEHGGGSDWDPPGSWTVS